MEEAALTGMWNSKTSGSVWGTRGHGRPSGSPFLVPAGLRRPCPEMGQFTKGVYCAA